jgi:hypothetical protein
MIEDKRRNIKRLKIRYIKIRREDSYMNIREKTREKYHINMLYEILRGKDKR